ncbi:MAG: hypothetical protein ACRD3F_12620 [Acidobacteriaceae bacterium]
MRNKFCTLALTGFLTLGLAGGAAFAQDQTQTAPPETNNTNTAPMHHHHMRKMNSDRQLKRMTKRYDLSADQQSQIKPILDSQDQQMEQLRQDNTMSRQDRRQKMMDIHQDSSQKIEAVLNDTQKQKYEADQAKMKEHRMNHHHNQQQGTAPESSQPQ